jgi:hypothetical protein
MHARNARSSTSGRREALLRREERLRLERLGARRIAKVKTWWVLEAPTGQRFCVVRAKIDLASAAGANTWPDE